VPLSTQGQRAVEHRLQPGRPVRRAGSCKALVGDGLDTVMQQHSWGWRGWAREAPVTRLTSALVDSRPAWSTGCSLDGRSAEQAPVKQFWAMVLRQSCNSTRRDGDRVDSFRWAVINASSEYIQQMASDWTGSSHGSRLHPLQSPVRAKRQ
jgi:hypothetical protein